MNLGATAMHCLLPRDVELKAGFRFSVMIKSNVTTIEDKIKQIDLRYNQ